VRQHPARRSERTQANLLEFFPLIPPTRSLGTPSGTVTGTMVLRHQNASLRGPLGLPFDSRTSRRELRLESASFQKWLKHGLQGKITPLQTNRIMLAIGDRLNWGGTTGV
jgi:hypothetical protein